MRVHFHFSLSCIGEGNGNPLQCSCLENARDSGAWWAAIYGVAQSWTRLKRLSSGSNTRLIYFWKPSCFHLQVEFGRFWITIIPVFFGSRISEKRDNGDWLCFLSKCLNRAVLYSVSIIKLSTETCGKVPVDICLQILLLCLGARDKMKWSVPSSASPSVAISWMSGGPGSMAKLSFLMARFIWEQGFIKTDLAGWNWWQEQVYTDKFDMIPV